MIRLTLVQQLVAATAKKREGQCDESQGPFILRRRAKVLDSDENVVLSLV